VRQRALIVLFTTIDEAAITEGLLPVLPSLTQRHVVMVASVSDPHVREMGPLMGVGNEIGEHHLPT